MPRLSFEGETHDDIVRQVRRWLRSTDGQAGHIEPADAVQRMADLTKDALSLIASAAPETIAHSEVVKGLAHMGYEVTDETAHALQDALNAVNELSGTKVVKRLESAGREMSYSLGISAARTVRKVLLA